MTKESTSTLTLDKEKARLSFSIGRLVEPLARARKWYADAWSLLGRAGATEEQIATIAKKWDGRSLSSPYIFIESRDGEHPSWPKIKPTTFAVISACLLVESLRDLADAEKAGKATDLDSAIGLFWICRYAWNMSKATSVTPAAMKAALSANAKKAADARHDAPGGARDLKRTAWELFLSGDYGVKKDGAAEKIAPIVGKSFGVTRRYLQGDAPADLKSKSLAAARNH